MLLAHIAGVPVEETVLGLAPLGVAGLGALVATAWHQTWRLRHPRHDRRTRTPPPTPAGRA